MKERRSRPVPLAGPLRWSYRQYSITERASPRGRRYEVRSPTDELVLFCRFRRADPMLSFFGDDQEKIPVFRFEPKKVRRFARSYSVVDAITERPFADVHKRVYEPDEKEEWFLFNLEGEQIGMVIETAREPTLLRRLVPGRLSPRAWALHWGQSIGGTIQPKKGLVGERIEVDLTLDTRDAIDRRLALGVAVAIRAEQHKAEAPPSA